MIDYELPLFPLRTVLFPVQTLPLHIFEPRYRQMIADLCSFLEGRTHPIVSRMQAEMEAAAEKLEFERAATLRDQIQAIETVVERQKIVSSDYIDSDVLALARDKNDACVQVFFIRGGKLIGRDYFLLEGADEKEDAPGDEAAD